MRKNTLLQIFRKSYRKKCKNIYKKLLTYCGIKWYYIDYHILEKEAR